MDERERVRARLETTSGVDQGVQTQRTEKLNIPLINLTMWLLVPVFSPDLGFEHRHMFYKVTSESIIIFSYFRGFIKKK